MCIRDRDGQDPRRGARQGVSGRGRREGSGALSAQVQRHRRDQGGGQTGARRRDAGLVLVRLMRGLVCRELAPADRLAIIDIPDPEAGPGEVVIEVKAAGLNFLDTLVIEGKYQAKPDLPFVPGGEAAGIIAAVGDGVSGLTPGMRVMALGQFGAFADKWTVPAVAVLPMPEGLNFETAAGFGLAYGTSHYALKQRADLQPGETLLVLGAAGGVGSAAV